MLNQNASFSSIANAVKLLKDYDKIMKINL